MLRVDNKTFGGRLDTALATDQVVGTEPLPALAERRNALAAMSGGFFITTDDFGTRGDLMGISAIDGELVSEAVEGRSSLLVPDDDGFRAWTAPLSTALHVVAADGARRELDGLNRRPGVIRGCGGVGGDVLDGVVTTAAVHDCTCTDDSELTLLRPISGGQIPPAAHRLALTTDGTVLGVAPDGPVPAGQQVLLATGSAADWVDAHAAIGTTQDGGIAVFPPDDVVQAVHPAGAWQPGKRQPVADQRCPRRTRCRDASTRSYWCGTPSRVGATRLS